MTRAPVAIATWTFGSLAVREGGEILARGGSSLDAVEAGIQAVELDPEVISVGHGGLPNASGFVELDAAIMHGPGHRAGAVAALREIVTPIAVARAVMERTRHTFLVGEGALDFALQCGFERRPLLTEAARQRWKQWCADPERRTFTVHDTVGMAALDGGGSLCVGCSTSGLAFKLAGRVGDSPVIGAGLYCDADVGAAAATGDGDAILRFALSYTAVEAMRGGRRPREACEAALDRMRSAGSEAEAALVALDRDGEAGAAVTGRDRFPWALWTPRGVELRESVAPGVSA